MATKGKYKQVEQKHGKPMPEILIELYAKHGGSPRVQEQVAAELEVTQGTISMWLLKCGLRQTVRLVDREAAQS